VERRPPSAAEIKALRLVSLRSGGRGRPPLHSWSLKQH